MEKLAEMLNSPQGREALMDAIPLVFKTHAAAPRFDEAPLNRIAWAAAHRPNSLPTSLTRELEKPVELNRVTINGEVLYLAHDGNHRIERFVEAERKTIPAMVYDRDLEPAMLQKGRITGYRLEYPAAPGLPLGSGKNINAAQADVLKALDLVKDETVPSPPPPRKRRLFGFGIGD